MVDLVEEIIDPNNSFEHEAVQTFKLSWHQIELCSIGYKRRQITMNRTKPETSTTSSGGVVTTDSKFVFLAADHFQKLYYDVVDKRRHLMSKLYLDTGVLVWNGHSSTNATEIQKFYNNLASTTHTVTSVDSMFVPEIAVGAQKTILVSVEGTVFLRNEVNRITKPFSQTFILTHHQEKWKIVSDIFRTQTPCNVQNLCA